MIVCDRCESRTDVSPLHVYLRVRDGEQDLRVDPKPAAAFDLCARCREGFYRTLEDFARPLPQAAPKLAAG